MKKAVVYLIGAAWCLLFVASGSGIAPSAWAAAVVLAFMAAAELAGQYDSVFKKRSKG